MKSGAISGNTSVNDTGDDISVMHANTKLVFACEKDALEMNTPIYNVAPTAAYPCQVYLSVPAAQVPGLTVARDGYQLDQILVMGLDYTLTEADRETVTFSGMTDWYRAALDAEQNAMVVQASHTVGCGVYLAGNGEDSNDGLSMESPVATFARAKEILKKNASATRDNVIYILGDSSKYSELTVTGNETWSLEDVPNAYVQRQEDTSLVMVYVTGTLTLENITIDGNRYYMKQAQGGSLFRLSDSGTLNMKSGAVLQNTKAGGVGAFIQLNDAATLNVYDGAKIWGGGGNTPTASPGMVDVNDTSVVNVYGGEFVDSEMRAFSLFDTSVLNFYNGRVANCSVPGGGAVFYLNGAANQSTIHVYDGVFENNRITGSGNTYIGAILYAFTTCNVNFYGGTFRNNVCLPNPMANGFGCYCGGGSFIKDFGVNFAPKDGKVLDFTGQPVYLKGTVASCKVGAALTGNLELYFETAPAAGRVAVVGNGYTLTQADLAKITCRNEGVTLVLDQANNQIVVGG